MSSHQRFIETDEQQAADSPVGKIPRSGVAKTFRAFQYRDFRLIWAGAFASTTGSWMQKIAQSWLVYQMTGSAFYLGLTSFLAQLPQVLFLLVGGSLADRVDRRRVLLFSQFLQMPCALALMTLVATGWIQVWHFLVLAFVAGTGQAFGAPAYQTLMPNLVDRSDLPNAIALSSIQFNLARTIGPLLAAAALHLAGPAVCFGINGISFLAPIMTLYMIHSSFQPRPSDKSILSEIAQGFRFVGNLGSLRQLTFLGFVTTFCAIPVMTLLPAFASQVFDAGSRQYSLMMAATGAGSVSGALLYARLSMMKRRGLFTLWVQLGLAFLLACFSLSRILPLSYIILFFAGVGLMALAASITSLVQLASSEEMRGRVMSIFMLAFRSGMPLGDLLAGSVAARISPPFTLIMLAGLMGSVAVGFLLSKSSLKSL
ncbi:MAG: MFS transporter [Acidobacteriota bacterium]